MGKRVCNVGNMYRQCTDNMKEFSFSPTSDRDIPSNLLKGKQISERAWPLGSENFVDGGGRWWAWA